MNNRRAWFAVVCLMSVGLVRAWSDDAKSRGEIIEGKLKECAFHYYYGNVFGDAEEYLKSARMPLYVLNNGAGVSRTELQTRALLKQNAANIAKISKDEQKVISSNVLKCIDDSEIQFIGADTATFTFVIRPPSKPTDGVILGTLILHRKLDKWQVVEEITDSAPVPPDYTK